MNVAAPRPATTPADWATDQEVRWCPGCGDYAILKAVQRTMPELGVEPHKTVFISGIGCSSRFPYYMETFGFHTIHGRAPAVATGVKLANPELDVWIVTGDGDGLSIGGNHTAHLLRRNLDCQILLFNNEIYGLTKGQYSPTSRAGTRTPSTPFGSVERPVSPCLFALGAGARFVARAIDTHQKSLPEILKRAHAHKGASFVEIYQNCVVYNDGVFEDFTAKKTAAEHQLWVEHGQPLLFAGGAKGIALAEGRLALEVVDAAAQSDRVIVHDETDEVLAGMLARLGPATGGPVALGVLFCSPAPSFEQVVAAQAAEVAAAAAARSGPPDLDRLLRRGQSWEVKRPSEAALAPVPPGGPAPAPDPLP